MSEAPAATSRPRQEHRCFVCHRTYERADHLNRHLKSRKRRLQLFLGNSDAYSGTDDNERAYKCPDCGKGFNRA